jgi:hypothetical protein
MFRALINIAIDVNQFAFGKKKLCEILTRDLMVLVFSFTIIAVPSSSFVCRLYRSKFNFTGKNRSIKMDP